MISSISLRKLQSAVMAGLLVLLGARPTQAAQGVNPPGSLSATGISSSAIRLTWRDTNTAESGYKVLRSSRATGPFVEVAVLSRTVLRFQDNGLLPTTTYYYHVVTVKRGTVSDPATDSASTLGSSPSATSTATISTCRSSI